MTSLTLAVVTEQASEIPLASVITQCSFPALTRSNGLGMVPSPE